MTTNHFLVLQTDFGLKDGAVSAMHGVAHMVAPHVIVSDLTHEIPPYDIWAASYRLYRTIKYWPKGTTFVSVVDPGVGSNRKSIAAKTKKWPLYHYTRQWFLNSCCNLYGARRSTRD